MKRVFANGSKASRTGLITNLELMRLRKYKKESGDSVDEMDKLVAEFAEGVLRQTSAIDIGNHRAGNRWARRYLATFDALCALGDKGKDRLSTLFNHPNTRVREVAAVFLLKHRTEEALAILREVAKGHGLAALGASEAIKRWEEGSWNLEP